MKKFLLLLSVFVVLSSCSLEEIKEKLGMIKDDIKDAKTQAEQGYEDLKANVINAKTTVEGKITDVKEAAAAVTEATKAVNEAVDAVNKAASTGSNSDKSAEGTVTPENKELDPMDPVK